MDLITPEIQKLLPPLYANENKVPAEIRVPLKIFDPSGRGTWYVTEFSGEDTMFGYCRSPLGSEFDELGYMSLQELSTVINSYGLHMERDIYWNPETTLADVLEGRKR